jgi:ABC-2 type transport system ATP-binding protein
MVDDGCFKFINILAFWILDASEASVKGSVDMTDTAILVQDLAKRFGSVAALDGIDFEVSTGTVFGLLGPNGAGKTTAIRILTTILRPDRGRAEVLGHDVVRDPRGVRCRIGLAGQYAAVDPNLTGRENLRLIGRLAQMSRPDIDPRAKQLLERFDLTDAADRPVRTYSGGMRRRLDVAAALVSRPPVLFLDEPTTGLDLQSRGELWDMIRELVADGTTVLLTTQYMEEADRLAKRIAVIDRGKVIANDTPAALKSQMGGTVIEMGMDKEVAAARAWEVLSRFPSGHAERDGTVVRFTTSDGARFLIEALRSLDTEKLSPATLTVREPSLDDVFLSLTGHHAEPGDGQAEAAAAARRRRGAA